MRRDENEKGVKRRRDEGAMHHQIKLIVTDSKGVTGLPQNQDMVIAQTQKWCHN